MKKIFFLLFTIFTLNSNSQVPQIPAAGTTVINNALNKFEGTWQWVSGYDTLKIVLQKKTILMPAPNPWYQQMIIGWHRYVKNGIQIESSLQYISHTYATGHSTIICTTASNDTNKIQRGLIDLTKQKNCFLTFKLLPNSLTQARWVLKNNPGAKPGGFQYGFTIPTDIILTKLNVPPPPPPLEY